MLGADANFPINYDVTVENTGSGPVVSIGCTASPVTGRNYILA